MEISKPRGRILIDNATMKAKIEWTPGFEEKLNREYGAGGPLQKFVDYTILVDSITGKGAFYSEGYSFWSRPGVAKVETNIDLNYQNGRGPK